VRLHLVSESIICIKKKTTAPRSKLKGWIGQLALKLEKLKKLDWDTENMLRGALRNKTTLMGRVESRPISVKMSTAFGGLR